VNKKDGWDRLAPGGFERRDPFGRPTPADPASLRQPPSPYDAKLSLATIAWLAELPQEVAPLVLANQFPRIANRLSRFWDSPKMMEECFRELLVSRRGKRKGFPRKVLDELWALANYYRELHKSVDNDVWDSIPYRRPGT
jgi:hypothetical protein